MELETTCCYMILWKLHFNRKPPNVTITTQRIDQIFHSFFHRVIKGGNISSHLSKRINELVSFNFFSSQAKQSSRNQDPYFFSNLLWAPKLYKFLITDEWTIFWQLFAINFLDFWTIFEPFLKNFWIIFWTIFWSTFWTTFEDNF